MKKKHAGGVEQAIARESDPDTIRELRQWLVCGPREVTDRLAGGTRVTCRSGVKYVVANVGMLFRLSDGVFVSPRSPVVEYPLEVTKWPTA